MATILAIDSSLEAASVAALNEGGVIFESVVANGLFHSQTLMVAVQNSISQSKFKISSVDYVAVSMGPGSFTGLRIGVAAAKGLSTGWGVSCVGVSTLRSLAMNLADLPVVVCAVIDARNDYVYYGVFDVAQGRTNKVILCENVALIDELLLNLKSLNLKKTVVLVGNGAAKCYLKFKNQLLVDVVLADVNNSYVRASSVAMCAQCDLNNGIINKNFKLNYLRQPQAQRLLNRKQKAEKFDEQNK